MHQTDRLDAVIVHSSTMPSEHALNLHSEARKRRSECQGPKELGGEGERRRQKEELRRVGEEEGRSMLQRLRGEAGEDADSGAFSAVGL